jgi:hypothetical protein
MDYKNDQINSLIYNDELPKISNNTTNKVLINNPDIKINPTNFNSLEKSDRCIFSVYSWIDMG